MEEPGKYKEREQEKSEIAAGRESVMAENEDLEPTFDFEERSWRSDFVLNVEGKKLHVAKNILSFASPVFDRMFKSDFKDGNGEELTLPGKNVEDVKEFLRCIYPNCLVQVTIDNATQLLPLVEEYQVLHLKPRCEKVLVENVGEKSPTAELFHRLREAELFDLKRLREKCIALASDKTFEELTEAKKSSKPPAEALAKIYESKVVELNDKVVELETANDSLSKELNSWKSFVPADLKQSRHLYFEDKLKWQELHFVLSAPLHFPSSCTQKEIWGVPVCISTMTCTREKYYGFWQRRDKREWLCLKIEIMANKTVSCNINARIHLLNTQPNGENVYVDHRDNFNDKKQEMVIDVKKVNDIEDVEVGFVKDGNISLIINIYMSEPNIENKLKLKLKQY